MIRYFLAGVTAAILSAAAMAQPMPMAMPGKDTPPAAKPAATPLPTSPTVQMPPMEMSEGTCSSSSCGSTGCYSRPGLFQRIAGHWCGQRFARYDPLTCCTSQCEGSWTPVYGVKQCGSVRCGGCEKCRRERHILGFGFGRFLGRRCDSDCATSVSVTTTEATCSTGSARAWLGHACGSKEKLTHCQTTPYHSPARYYFTGETEPECPNGVCADGQCRISGHVATGLVRGHVAYPAGCIGGVPLFGERGGGRGLGDGGMSGGCRGRGHINHNEYAGAPYHKGRCYNGEQCFGLTGSHFQGNIRFARDEKPTPPAVNASKPYDYQGSNHDLLYMKNAESDPTIQQTGLTTSEK